MNLIGLFETQKALDERIVKEKGLEGQDLLSEKILALLTELGELSNEWRGFKFWSANREPRIYKEKEVLIGGVITGVDTNPLLEEYVDCLHFALSIGLETGANNWLEIDEFPVAYDNGSTTNHFLQVQINFLKTMEEFHIMETSALEIRRMFQTSFESLLQLGAQLSFTWNQIEQAYFDKNKINHSRQENNY